LAKSAARRPGPARSGGAARLAGAPGTGRGAVAWITSNPDVLRSTSTEPSLSARSIAPFPARRFRIVTEGSQSGRAGPTQIREPSASVVAWIRARIAINRSTEPAAQACGTFAPRYWTGNVASDLYRPAHSSGRR